MKMLSQQLWAQTIQCRIFLVSKAGRRRLLGRFSLGAEALGIQQSSSVFKPTWEVEPALLRSMSRRFQVAKAPQKAHSHMPRSLMKLGLWWDGSR